MDSIELMIQLQQPGWGLLLAGSSLVIDAPTKCAALKLIERATDQLALSVRGFKGYKDVVIRFPGCSRPYRVPVVMAEGEITLSPESPITDYVFGKGLSLNTNSFKILERICKSEKPMSLVNLSTDSQDWVNYPLVQMLNVSAEQATELNMRDYWEEDALSYVKRILQQQSRFEHSYEAFIPAGRARFSSTFEVVNFGSDSMPYRLVTIHEWNTLGVCV
ncbi:MAG: hypothetical protein SAL07_23680 [Oscillatoria sp. PMC 1051.18]|nr:hypothetical protein [Oscillatoria sp. PMC 1050.18]MEC5032914.1 hypothetical protein [Oscillatoria sp. PMC 1051.18]